VFEFFRVVGAYDADPSGVVKLVLDLITLGGSTEPKFPSDFTGNIRAFESIIIGYPAQSVFIFWFVVIGTVGS